jgi:hypothetical protein
MSALFTPEHIRNANELIRRMASEFPFMWHGGRSGLLLSDEFIEELNPWAVGTVPVGCHDLWLSPFSDYSSGCGEILIKLKTIDLTNLGYFERDAVWLQFRDNQVGNFDHFWDNLEYFGDTEEEIDMLLEKAENDMVTLAEISRETHFVFYPWVTIDQFQDIVQTVVTFDDDDLADELQEFYDVDREI